MSGIDQDGRAVSGVELITLLHHAVKTMGRARHRHGRFPHAQRRILSVLSEKPMEQRELLDTLDVRSSSLSEVLAKLEQNGLILRERDPRDKRGFVVSLTDAGKAEVSGYERDARLNADAVFSAFSDEERAKLRTLLVKLNTGLDEAAAGDKPGKYRRREPERYRGLDDYDRLHECERSHGCKRGRDKDAKHHSKK